MHNQLRNKVASGNQAAQPSATNMRELVWDKELQNLAQGYVNSCPTTNNPNRKTQSYQIIGENLYWYYSSTQQKVDYQNFVLSWFDQAKNFSSNGISLYQYNPNTASYTQMVWADTDKVGCGAITYIDQSWYRTILICNYATAGNIQRQPIYIQGFPASACKYKSYKYPSLCSNNQNNSTGNQSKDCSYTGKFYNGNCFIKSNSLEACQQCTDSLQCKVGYCDPFMKKCVANQTTACAYPVAFCNGANCDNKDFPLNWLKCQDPSCPSVNASKSTFQDRNTQQTISQQTKDCVDSSLNCQSNQNLCTSDVYKFIMQRTCRKTCGFC